jgi:hypothetical protein
MKLFISQPMGGKSDKETQRIRDAAIAAVKDMFDEHEPIEVIDSIVKDPPDDVNALWYLGNSILIMSKADVVYFAKGWKKSRGCVIENAIADTYGLCCVQTD